MLRRDLDFPMRADRRKREQLRALANDEETQRTEITINSVRGKVAGRPRIDNLFAPIRQGQAIRSGTSRGCAG